MSKEQDIFDRIMGWKLLRFALPFYTSYKEVLLYLLFGGFTTVISIGSFAVLYGIGFNEHAANFISWILAVAFAFWTNKTWVFQDAKGPFFKKMVSFYGGRVFTLIVEEIIIYFFVSQLLFSAVVVKITAQIVVLVLNYFVSKLWVFKSS